MQKSNLYRFSFQAFFPASCLSTFWWGGDTFSSYLAPFTFSAFTQTLCPLCCQHTCLSVFLPVHLSHHLSHSSQYRLLIGYSALCLNSSHPSTDLQFPVYEIEWFPFFPFCLRCLHCVSICTKPAIFFSRQILFCNVLEPWASKLNRCSCTKERTGCYFTAAVCSFLNAICLQRRWKKQSKQKKIVLQFTYNLIYMSIFCSCQARVDDHNWIRGHIIWFLMLSVVRLWL